MTVDLTHAAGEAQRVASVKSDRGNLETLPVFTDKETIAGHVHLSPAPGKQIDHLGVKIEVLGQTELYFDRGDAHDFVSLVRELVNPGEFNGPLSVPFEFKNVALAARELPRHKRSGAVRTESHSKREGTEARWFPISRF